MGWAILGIRDQELFESQHTVIKLKPKLQGLPRIGRKRWGVGGRESGSFGAVL